LGTLRGLTQVFSVKTIEPSEKEKTFPRTEITTTPKGKNSCGKGRMAFTEKPKKKKKKKKHKKHSSSRAKMNSGSCPKEIAI